MLFRYRKAILGMKRLIIMFFFISAGLFGEETGLQVGNAGEGGGTLLFLISSFSLFGQEKEEIIMKDYYGGVVAISPQNRAIRFFHN